ncbi:helix-turn-helix transcriptional regulator [Mesorhizobium sp.]|uniref:helix-turn-helix transcriptional regulator n=1 Tax=Mesorhizobium sp. TaxID=1871066 RepID=UPI000FE47FA1|nr:helix-turn-helix transcriptional regulator [Mesorhizobium sp.]RWO22844.1 MAG: XRE family transcriptional regulator [Mesorhizobium sp.]
MSDPIAQRLKEARINAGFKSVADAAKSLSVPYQTYAAHENGNRTFDNESAAKYARRYKVSLDWLLTGRGERKADLSLPERLKQKMADLSQADIDESFELFEGIVEKKLARQARS